MNLNITMIGQLITFVVFVWFCLKFVWPPLLSALEERQKKIADGLAAGEKGRHDLELAEKRALQVLHEAKDKAAEIVGHAEQRASEVADEAKEYAREEAAHILENAKKEIDLEINQAKEQLRSAVAQLAMTGAGKILEKEVDAKVHNKLVDELVKQL